MVAVLVDHGLVSPDRAEEARGLATRALSGPDASATPLRRRLAEAAGYVGGALVVAAAIIFLTEEWGNLSTTGRVLTLTGTAVLLFGASAVVVSSGRRAGAREPAEPGIRRRLASALATGAAVSAAGAVGVLVEERSAPASTGPWYLMGLALAAVALAGYRLAPSALGQVAVAAGLAQAVAAGVDSLFIAPDEIPYALGFVLLGGAWVVLGELEVWRERTTGLVLGCVLLLVGAQIPAVDGGDAWVGYLLTLAVAVATLVLYLGRRSVPYLVTAVAALTLVVPEALLDWTDGSLGPVGALLVTGVTLLAASLLGLRLHRAVGDDASTGVSAAGGG